jgi:beta-N-acetylhexosaminidase
LPTKAPQGPRAIVLGCAGERLNAEERRLFSAVDPFGFVLFRRNCHDPDQLRALVDERRGNVGRAPVLIVRGVAAGCSRALATISAPR